MRDFFHRDFLSVTKSGVRSKMEIICLVLVFTSMLASTTADYECLCNYHVEVDVHPMPTQQSPRMGTLYEFDCKPTYVLTASTPQWQAIQFEKKVGYIALDDKTKVQTCPGNPTSDDIVPPTTPLTSLVLSSKDSTFQPSSTPTPTPPTMSRPTTTAMNTMTTTMPTTTATATTLTTTSTTKRPLTSSLSSTAASTTVSQTSSTSTVRSTVTTPLRTTKNVVLQVSSSTSSLPIPSTTSTSNPMTTRRKSTVTSTQTTTSTISTTARTTTSRALQCPPQIPRSRNLREYGGHCYEFILGEHKDWAAAEHDCNIRGGHLVSVGSKAEQDFVYHSLGVLHFHDDKGVWIGLTDQHHEGHWAWSSGERVAFTHWASGQPGVLGSLEDCALMDMHENGYWGDYSCNDILFHHQRHGYVCEYNKI